MKNLITPLAALIIIATSGFADAAPWSASRDRRAPEPPRHSDHRDSRYDRDRGHNHGYDRRRPMRLEARAQLRLRELGFYRGPVDGEFGRNSRAALMRFQHSRGLRATGALTPSTIRALRL